MRNVLLFIFTLPLTGVLAVLVYSIWGAVPFYIAGVLLASVIAKHCSEDAEADGEPKVVLMEKVTFSEKRKTICEHTGDEVCTTSTTVTNRPQSAMFKGAAEGSAPSPY